MRKTFPTYLVSFIPWLLILCILSLFFLLFFSPVASQIMAKYGWKDGQGNEQIIFILVLHDNSIYG